MAGRDVKYVLIREEERPPLLAYCTRHLVGFISDTDTDFYGSGVIVNIDGTWAIATAAHVAIARSGPHRLVFPGAQPEFGPQPKPIEVRESRPLCVLVSRHRSGRDWRLDELDLAIIVPAPDVFTGIPGIGAIDLGLRECNPRVASGRHCLLAGFPHRFQGHRSERVLTTNILSSHFVASPAGARPDDIAVNWAEVFQLSSGQHEDCPNAGGMSGGPVFLYSETVGSRVWTAQRQLPLAGILHYQVPGGASLLAHSSQALREFILTHLNDPGQKQFREAVAAGFS